MSGSTELAALGIKFSAEGGDETFNAFLKITGAAENLIQKLNIQAATFGYSKEAMIGFAAGQLGVSNETQHLIRSITELTVAAEQASIQQRRDLELYKMRSDAAKKLEADITSEAAAYFAAMNKEIAVSEEAAASVIALNAQRNRAFAENRAAAMAMLDEQEAAQIAAAEAEQARQIAFNAFKIRTMNENRAEAIRILDEQEKAAEVFAEKQAQAEIKWASLSYEVRIKQLKDLQAYQASTSISPETTAKQFINVPQSVQGDAAAKEVAYAEALKVEQDAAKKAAAEVRALSSAHGEAGVNINRATSELVVLGREFERGNFSKMGGSFTVLAQALGGLTSPLTLVGAALAYVGFEVIKGSVEFEKMRESLIMTNNYAGLTTDGLIQLAHAASEAGGTIGVAKEAVTQLAASGKFTAESISTISKAATLMEEATGQSVSATIKQFEALAVQSTGKNAQATEAITKAAIKQNETYHFLNVTILENIMALEREGDAKGASKVTTDALAAALSQRSKEMIENAGNVLKAWREVKTLFSEMNEAIAAWGRTGPASEMVKLQKEYELYNNSLMTGLGTESAKAATQAKLLEISQQMVVAQQAINDANSKATEQGKQTQADTAATVARFQIEQMNITLQKKGMSELNIALGEYKHWRDEIAKTNPEDAMLDPKKIEETIAAITKAHTPKLAASGSDPANPLDNNIVQMKVKIAGYQAQAEAAQKAADTDVNGMQHVNEAQVAARIAAGEFATLKKGWSADDQAAKIKELEISAKQADTQKFVLDGAKALSAAQEKATKDVAALNGKLNDNQDGIERQPKAYENAAVALLAFWGKSKESAEGQKLIATAQLEDIVKIRAANEDKLIAESKNYTKSAADAMIAGDALMKYGAAGKASTIEIANAAIAQAQLTSKIGEGVIQALRSAAASKQISESYKNLSKDYQDAMVVEQAKAAVTGTFVLGAEQAKIVAIADANRRKLAYYKADADAAISAARLGSGGATLQQEEDYKAFLALYNKKAELATKSQALNFNIAGLQDMAGIFSQMGTAVASFSDGLANVGTALDGMGAALGKVAKAQQLQADTGQNTTSQQVAGYAAMATAAEGFFTKGSKGYNTMHAIAAALHVSEMGMEAAKLAMKVQTAIEGMAVDDASTLNSVANSALQAEASASAAIAKCYEQLGPIWGSIAAGAVVAALVGAGVHVMGGGGSATTPDAQSAAEMQKKQGTGTVIGDSAKDSTKQSDSINQALTTMATNSNLMLPLTSQMASSLKTMVTGIGGVATLISGNSEAIANGLNLNINVGKSATGILGDIFGSTSTTIKNAGLQFGGTTVSGIQNGGGASQFATVNEDKKGFLGLFGGSNSTYDKTSSLDASVNQQFSLVFKNLQSTLTTAAQSLGLNADSVASAVNSAQVPLSKISLMGLTGTQQIAAISAVLSSSMDTIAAKVMPSLTAYAQMGEGAFQTTLRVASGIEAANTSLKNLGLTAINYTQVINKQGDIELEIDRQTMLATQSLSGGVLTGIGKIIQTFNGTATDLITLWTTLKNAQQAMNNTGLNGNNLTTDTINGAGGTSNLTKGLADFLKGYFTPAQQSAAELSDLSKQFTTLGVAMPTTIEGMKMLIQGINTTGPAGQALQGALLNLSGAFKTAYDNAVALGSPAITAANSALTSSYNTASTAIQNTISQLANFAKSTEAFKESLNVGNLSVATPYQKYQTAQSQYQSTLAAANGGDVTAQGNLQNVTTTFLTASQAAYASSARYQADFAKVQQDLANTAINATGKQATDAQQQLTLLNQQVSGLVTINTSVIGVTQAIANLTKATQDAAIKIPVTQSSGISSDVGPIASVLKDLKLEVAGLRADQKSQTGALIQTNYDATQKAASVTASATSDSARKANWAYKVKGAMR